MKIAYCLAGTFNSGGMERIVIGKANWLARHGYGVCIITTEQKGRPDFYPLDGRIKRIDLDILYSDTNNLGVIKKFFERFRRMKYHRTLLEDVIREERPDILISTFGNEVSLIPKIKADCVKIAEIHFSRWYRLQLNRKGIWKMIDKLLTAQDNKVLSGYDKFVCLTQEDRLNWDKHKNVDVIPNFIEAISETPAHLDTKEMIAVGRLSYQKGYDRLIKAWKIVTDTHPEWKLNIYGGGELYEELSSLIATQHLSEQVIIHPPVKNIEEKYLESSSLVLSSHYEGLPMVLLEAMSGGVPPIAFTCQCGPKDLIKDGVNGVLVEEGNIKELANAIIRLIENPQLRIMMGKKAFEDAKSYNVERVMEKWTALFHSLCSVR